MKVLNPFNTSILGSIIPFKNQIDSYYNFISSQSYIKKPSNGSFSSSQKILENPLFDTLRDEILFLSKTYLTNLKHLCNDVQISSSWISFSNNNEGIHSHYHSNSYLSGVFYLKKSTDIVFLNPLTPLWKFLPETMGNDEYTITPEPGLIIIFPSFLGHYVKPTQNDRFSISFNIIPKGEFGGNTMKLYL